MLGRVYTGAISGIEGILVTVEADAGDGLPSFDMVGYLGSEVKEARERVRTALKNAGFLLPPCRITVNLSPADLRKQGNCFDLPIAAALLTACGFLPPDAVKGFLFLGELGLDGSLRPIDGALALCGCGLKKGISRVMLPAQNAQEAACAEGVFVISIEHIKEMVRLLLHQEEISYAKERPQTVSREPSVDFADINGQKLMKRATEIAAAGMHNILYIGPPGCGKTMAARRIPSILPPMTKEEQVEVSKIYSICGMLKREEGLIGQRPFRSPHHTISAHALAGGGSIPRPGEISLAHEGVLFLDELPEFKRQTLEALRQPLEEGRIVISRVHGSCVYPARIMLAAAMNPCPCGYYPDRQRCRCTAGEVARYLNRISQPLLDRIDITVEVKRAQYGELTGPKQGESSQKIAERVEKAVRIQKKRYKQEKINFNGELSGGLQRRYCRLGKEEAGLLETAFGQMGLSARGASRILCVARTIADLEGEEEIRVKHLSEAISYRAIDKKYWGMER